MNEPEKRSFARLRAAWGHSCRGLADAWMREEAFRLEAILLLLSIPAAAFLASSFSQAALLVGSILLLMIVEILNSAIEATIDRIGPERHELSRVAKDLGSAAVLLTTLFPVGVWLAVIADTLGLIEL